MLTPAPPPQKKNDVPDLILTAINYNEYHKMLSNNMKNIMFV